MSKFTTVKCWHMPNVTADPAVVQKAEPTVQLVKKSILKNGYRAYAIQDRADLEKQEWYELFMGGNEVCFCIDGSGVYRLVNFDSGDNEFYFERMNVPVGHKPWVFYSWQSDYNPSRSHIKEALTAAIDEINKTLNPRQKIELVESTRADDGAKDIVQAIKDNIDKSLLAVFDITNVAMIPAASASDTKKGKEVKAVKVKLKSYPNANVVFELSYALCRKQLDQIVLVKRGGRDDLGDDNVPFDFAHNRRIDYLQPKKVRSAMKDLLVEYLRRINYIQANS